MRNLSFGISNLDLGSSARLRSLIGIEMGWNEAHAGQPVCSAFVPAWPEKNWGNYKLTLVDHNRLFLFS
jgi:hypothetical protein